MASNAPAAPPASEGSPLAFMARLAPNVYLYTPPSAAPDQPAGATASRGASPRLVLLASWMGARDAHIAKYVAAHQALFPEARILLVRCELRHMLRPATAAASVREVVVPVLRSSFSSPPPPPPSSSSARPQHAQQPHPQLLIHAFSNGGVATLNHVHAALRAVGGGDDNDDDDDKVRLPPYALILDSAPGRWTYSGALAAVLAVIPARGGAAFFYRLVARVFTLAMWFAYAVLRRPDPHAARGRALNDAAARRAGVAGGGGGEVRRCYVYGVRDRLVGWRDVEAHAQEARRAGFVVRSERFEQGEHVALARAAPDRYWRAVRETWEGKGFPPEDAERPDWERVGQGQGEGEGREDGGSAEIRTAA